MGKSKYKRDWHKYDENVITRYTLMFPFYVFEHWWDLLAEENRHAKKTYKAPKEFNEFLAFLHIFLPPTGNPRKTRERIKPSITREKEINK
jgi:hypothetical protein